MIYVDGCCNSTIGSCSSVTDKDGNCLIKKYKAFLDHCSFLFDFNYKNHNNRIVYEIKFDDVKSQQNNGAELVAMCIGLLIGIYFNKLELYSDSDLMVKYWSNKESKTIKCKRKAKIQRYCIELADYYKSMGGKIIKIGGDCNPADLGFHKK